jgi:hypothetical protein
MPTRRETQTVCVRRAAGGREWPGQLPVRHPSAG